MDKIKKIKLRFIFAVIVGLLLVSFAFVLKYSAAQSAVDPTDNADAIAVRVVPNPNHYSIARWYESQGFVGSPQTLIVDGYEAIRDGRTVYISAANIDPSANPPLIYTNIYLISYNQNPAPKTVDILGQIIAHWKFNGNLTESGVPTCSISSLSCAIDADCGQDQFCASSSAVLASSSCLLKTPKNCLTDTDCPLNFFCDSVKAKIGRDLKRVGRLEELKEALFKFKTFNNRYPLLSAGTYLNNLSVSVWPSWSQSLLSDLAVSQNFLDPINRLGPCPGYDAGTCWNQDTKRFINDPVNNSLTLPAGSYALVYATDNIGSNYNLCATLETRSSSLNYHFSPNDPSGSNCVTAGIVTGGQTGNTAPRLVDEFLSGGADQEFNGFIKLVDAENNPLTWSLDLSGASWNDWAEMPHLVDTSDPNQKKVYASKAGQPGIFNITLTVTDGQGGTLMTTVPITITGSVPFIEAENAEYTLDPTIAFDYNLFFSGDNFSNPGVNTATLTKTSGPFDLFSGLTATFSVAGTNRYKINYHGLIPTTNKLSQDTDFNYRIVVADKYSASAIKNFSIRVKAENPQLDFNCPIETRLGQTYNCLLGPVIQSNHTLTYQALNLPTGISMTPPSGSPALYYLSGVPTVASTGREVTITATNEYGASSAKKFVLKVNNYCGDGQKQSPNTEGLGGLYNDGYEDCDGGAGVTSNVASSSIAVQYGCQTESADTPNPILTNTYCVFKSPVDGGGYCGDGYCQTNEVSGLPENCKTCNQDCGNCIATIESDAELEQIAYFNGTRIYKAVSPTIGKTTRSVLAGDNTLAFWMHNNTNTKYGFAYRILVGPTDKPYDVIDTTNSYLRCAVAPTTSHNFSGTPSLSYQGYEPSGELINQGYKWIESDFPETGSFINSTVLFTNSRLEQINIEGKSVVGTYLPYIWGQKLATSSSSAYYCRLNYNYDLRNLDVCRPRCQDRLCGNDGCGGVCGTCATGWMCVDEQYCCEKSCQNKCVGKGSCTFSGKVEDWMSGSGISGVSIVVKNSAGTTVGNTTTNSSGDYSLAVVSATGNYTVTASKTGYSNSFKTFTAKTDKTIDFIMNTSGYDGVRKMLLRWGPLDLDSHLRFGPTANPNQYHVYYGTLSGGDAYLDCDDMNSQALDCIGNTDDHTKGQENIRIVAYTTGATYKYYIHDWTHSTNPSACNFAGATVTAYDAGNAQLATYTGAASPNKCYWHIFNMSSTGSVTTVNTYKSTEP